MESNSVWVGQHRIVSAVERQFDGMTEVVVTDIEGFVHVLDCWYSDEPECSTSAELYVGMTLAQGAEHRRARWRALIQAGR